MRANLIARATILISMVTAAADAQTISSDRVGERFCWLKETRFENDAKLDEALQYFRQAKAAGYTGVVLANTKWLALPGAQSEDYQRRLRALGAEAKELGLDVIPYVTNFGSAGAMLSHDPNIAEGMPVNDALFVVEGREARVKNDPPIPIVNAGFEDGEENKFGGWTFETAKEGVSAFGAREVVHRGERSVRMENFARGDANGNCRLTQPLQLTSFRQYRVKVWIKTEQLQDPAARISVSFWTGAKHLSFIPIRVKTTQDWTLHQYVFNSQKGGTVQLRVGVESRSNDGKVWFDDLSLEEVGFLNVVRRPGCPITVRGEEGNEYEEGRDFQPVRDPKLFRANPWGEYGDTHEPPPLRLTKNSRIKDGERLRVSFYHASAVKNGQVSICLSCPRAYELFEQGIEQLDELLDPAGYLISCGEIRNANWDAACRDRQLTPAQLLGDSIKKRNAIIRRHNPEARIYVWSDMFDPWHNARDNYFLCNGSWVGSWYHLPRDVIVMNWNYSFWNYSGHDGQSPRFFAENGFSQIVVGRGPDVAKWLSESPDVPNVIGVFNFIAPSLEEFADLLWRESPARDES